MKKKPRHAPPDGADPTVEEEAFPPKRTARYLGLKSEDVLRLWRANKEGPPYFRKGKRLIRYRRRDLDKWIEDRIVMTAGT